MNANNQLSSDGQLLTEVQQGSILGPLLYSLYKNELSLQCYIIGTQVYVDDSVIYVEKKSHLNSLVLWLE